MGLDSSACSRRSFPILIVLLPLACSRSPADRLSDCLSSATEEAKLNPTEPRDWRCESPERLWVVAMSRPAAKAALVTRGLPEPAALMVEHTEYKAPSVCVVRRLMPEAQRKTALRSMKSGSIAEFESICCEPDIPVPQLSVAEGQAFELRFKATAGWE